MNHDPKNLGLMECERRVPFWKQPRNTSHFSLPCSKGKPNLMHCNTWSWRAGGQWAQEPCVMGPPQPWNSLEWCVATSAQLAPGSPSPARAALRHQAAVPSFQPSSSTPARYSKTSNLQHTLNDKSSSVLPRKHLQTIQKFTVLHKTTLLMHWGWNGDSAVKCGERGKKLNDSTFGNVSRKDADVPMGAAEHLFTDREPGSVAMSQKAKQSLIY